MKANVAAIQRLLPASSPNGSVSSHNAPSIRGACPYDTIRSLHADAFTPAFTQVVDAIRSDAQWAPVWAGDLTNYGGDHSAAELAICGELARRRLTGQEIDTAVRASGLFREKWERDDYRQRTIAKALIPSAAPTAVIANRPLKLADFRLGFSDAAPQPRDWTIEGVFLSGKSVVLAGLGGTAKTQLALLASIAVATGSPFAGRATKQGRVLFISGEEDHRELVRRGNAYIRINNLDVATQTIINDRLLAYPAVGHDIRLTKRIGSALQSTDFDQQIIGLTKEAGDVRLIVLDHVGLLHGGDFNAKEDAALTMRLINGIANETGAAVILLAHSPKGSAKDEESDAAAIFGSTAFVEQARGAWILATMRATEAKQLGISEASRTDYVSLVGVKANYSRAGQAFWFRKTPFDEIAVLEHVQLTPPPSAGKSTANLQATIVAAVRSSPGRYSKTGMRETCSGVKGPWKASKSEVAFEIDQLLSDGRLINRPPTEVERKKFGHGPQVRAVLDIGAVQ